MAYAVLQDAIDLYSEEYILTSGDRDENGFADSQAFTDAFEGASTQIDSYLGQKETVPLTIVPAFIVRFTIDVAIYVLSVTHKAMTDEKTTRYKEAIAWCEAFVKGEVGISSGAGASDATIEYVTSPRVWTRTKAGGIL